MWADKNLPKVSLATVYNTLNLLVEMKLVNEFRLTQADKVKYDPNVKPHFHFLDTESNTLYDIEPEKVKMTNNLGDEFSVENVEVLFKGKAS